jgi:uncharacterized protein YidB (DUF937 family)
LGLFDRIGSAVRGVIESELATNAPALINAVLAKTNMGDLQGLVTQLRQNGLDEQVRSWLSNGPNVKVTPEQIESALGNEQLQQIAAHLGIPLDTVSKMLAEHLPTAVDQASPNGVIQNS